MKSAKPRYTKINRQDKNSGGCMSVSGEQHAFFDKHQQYQIDPAMIVDARKAEAVAGTEQLRKQQEDYIHFPAEMLKRYGQLSLWGTSSPDYVLRTA